MDREYHPLGKSLVPLWHICVGLLQINGNVSGLSLFFNPLSAYNICMIINILVKLIMVWSSKLVDKNLVKFYILPLSKIFKVIKNK